MNRLPRPAVRFGRRMLPVRPVGRPTVPAIGPPSREGIRPGDTVQVSGVGLLGGRAAVERIERRGAATLAILEGARVVPVGRCRRLD